VRLREEDGHLTFEVADDGVGFDPASKGYGTGLQGMADRLAALAGELRVTSSPGAGTIVAGGVPVEVADPVPIGIHIGPDGQAIEYAVLVPKIVYHEECTG